MKLYAYTPIGHRANSYFVMALSETEASKAILKLIEERDESGYSETEFKLHYYTLEILHPGEVFSVSNN